MNLHLRVLLVAVLLSLTGSALADRTADEAALELERLLRSAEESREASRRNAGGSEGSLRDGTLPTIPND